MRTRRSALTHRTPWRTFARGEARLLRGAAQSLPIIFCFLHYAAKTSQRSCRAFPPLSAACFSLDEFETAKAAFAKGRECAQAAGLPDDQFRTWIRKCDAELSSEEVHLSAAAAPAPAVTASVTPAAGPAPAAAPR